MDTAIQLLLTFGLGLLAGQWLSNQTGQSLYVVAGAILGMAAGIWFLYKKSQNL